MNGSELERVPNTKYLGTTISEDMSWSTHTDQVAGKAHSMLAFLSRNLWMLPEKLCEKAYLTIVPPGLEYACSITDPYLNRDIRKLEGVQRHAARFVTNNPHNRFSPESDQVSVSSLIDGLGWQSLQERRKNARCILMYRVIHGLIAVPEDLRPGPPQQSRSLRSTTRNSLPHIRSKLNAHYNSFTPRTSRDWNRLPPAAKTASSLEGFKVAL